MAGQEHAERAPVLDLVEHSQLGGEGRLALLHPALGLGELGGEGILALDQGVEGDLVRAQPGVVLEQLRVELGQHPLEPHDLALGGPDQVPDVRLLGIDLS